MRPAAATLKLTAQADRDAANVKRGALCDNMTVTATLCMLNSATSTRWDVHSLLWQWTEEEGNADD